uniref:ubiquitinyl hydrolase 1 n=1 Tax=Eptatretus burgeri TaxID=7764 RepID=A0A8C4WZG3_EPTBU
MAGQWCLIESDPGVFTELLRGFGLYSGTGRGFAAGGRDDRGGCEVGGLIGVIFGTWLGYGGGWRWSLNAQEHPGLMKGLALSNSDTIREVHNSFSRQQLLEGEATPGCRDDAFHFVSFVPIGGHLYELDGLKEGPVDLGPCELTSWLSAVRPVIERRIQRFQEGEIRFNLMAVVSDRRLVLKKRIEDLTGVTMDTGEGSAWPTEIQSELEQMRLQIEEEEKKLQRYRVECARRRHNFLPFILELLRMLAQQQRLLPLVQQVRER